MEPNSVVLVEIDIDVGVTTLVLSACFVPPELAADLPEFWGALQRGMMEAVKRRWRPDWRWQGTESSLVPYLVTRENQPRVQQALVAPADSAERWQVVECLPPAGKMGTRFGTRGGDRNGQAQ